MPWSGETYSLPAGTTVSPNTTIQSTWANTLTADLQSGMNFTRPVSRGGTGATTAIGAADNLSTISSDIASSSTTDLSTATGIHVTITGTTTITGFGTEQAGAIRILTFEDSLTLTHNTTSLILPTGANITTAANDVFTFRSEGSGNWRCIGYQLANGGSFSSGSTISKTTAYTVTTSDNFNTILCDATSASFTITLLAAATAGNGFEITVKKTDSTVNTVTIDGDGTETIDGAATLVLYMTQESVTIVCDGSNWAIKSSEPGVRRSFTAVVADASSGGNTGGVGTQNSHYKRTRDTVTIWVSLTNVDRTGLTSANPLYIRNLPFAEGNKCSVNAIVFLQNAGIPGAYVVARLQQNTDYITLASIASAATATNLAWSGFTDDVADIDFTMTYLAQ